MRSRRLFISGVATASTVAIAGCSNTSPSMSGPEVAAEQYITETINDDVDSTNEVLHPKSPLYPLEEGDLETPGDYSFGSANQVSSRELTERRIEQNDATVEEVRDEAIENEAESLEEQAEEIRYELGADDYAYVWVIVVQQDGEYEIEEGLYLLTVQDDDDWYIAGYEIEVAVLGI